MIPGMIVVEKKSGSTVVPVTTLVTVEVGKQGPAGTPGNNGFYTHHQQIPSAIWSIVHNLGFVPAGLVIVDTQGTQVTGDVEVVDSTTLRLHFVNGFAGTAYLS